jgi:hypothetical protein
MAKGGPESVFEKTRRAVQECHARMDFSPRTREEAEARHRLIEACVKFVDVYGCILSERMPD